MTRILKTSHYLILLLTMAGGQGDKTEEPFWMDRAIFPQESDLYCSKRAKPKSLLSSLCLCRVDPFLQSCFVTQEPSAASWVAPFQVPQNNNQNIFLFSISEALLKLSAPRCMQVSIPQEHPQPNLSWRLLPYTHFFALIHELLPVSIPSTNYFFGQKFLREMVQFLLLHPDKHLSL